MSRFFKRGEAAIIGNFNTDAGADGNVKMNCCRIVKAKAVTRYHDLDKLLGLYNIVSLNVALDQPPIACENQAAAGVDLGIKRLANLFRMKQELSRVQICTYFRERMIEWI
jgi:hypothetical protein